MLIISTINKEGFEYGLSFTCHNPFREDYFKMVDEQTAEKLRDYISNNFIRKIKDDK